MNNFQLWSLFLRALFLLMVASEPVTHRPDGAYPFRPAEFSTKCMGESSFCPLSTARSYDGYRWKHEVKHTRNLLPRLLTTISLLIIKWQSHPRCLRQLCFGPECVAHGQPLGTVACRSRIRRYSQALLDATSYAIWQGYDGARWPKAVGKVAPELSSTLPLSSGAPGFYWD